MIRSVQSFYIRCIYCLHIDRESRLQLNTENVEKPRAVLHSGHHGFLVGPVMKEGLP